MDYYAHYFSRLTDLSPEGRRKTWFDLRRHYDRFLPNDRAARILDFGCGAGRMLEWLRDARGFTQIQGVDVDPGQVAFSRSLGLTVVESAEPASWLHSQDPFDLIFLIDVLEHLPSETASITLQSIVRLLKPGGRLIVRVPNANGAFATRYRYQDPTHVRLYTEVSLRSSLLAEGFTTLRVVGDDVWAVRSLGGVARLTVRAIARAFRRMAAIGEFGPEGLRMPLDLNLIAEAEPTRS